MLSLGEYFLAKCAGLFPKLAEPRRLSLDLVRRCRQFPENRSQRRLRRHPIDRRTNICGKPALQSKHQTPAQQQSPHNGPQQRLNQIIQAVKRSPLPNVLVEKVIRQPTEQICRQREKQELQKKMENRSAAAP